MIYFWSDTHFLHSACIAYCNRPYSTVEEMTNDLVDRWNSVVSSKDTIWHLGDFGFKNGAALEEIFRMLNGHKCLTVGNHDERNRNVMRLPWERVERLVTIRDSGARAEACHYALETWNRAARGALMIHGHSHGNLKRVVPHRFDVGVDVRPFPVSFERLLQEAAQQQYDPGDHHTEREDSDGV